MHSTARGSCNNTLSSRQAGSAVANPDCRRISEARPDLPFLGFTLIFCLVFARSKENLANTATSYRSLSGPGRSRECAPAPRARDQARQRNPNPNFLVRIFSGGVGVFHVNGWGPKSSVWASKPGKPNFFGGISRDFAGISRTRPKSLRTKKFVFNFRSLGSCNNTLLSRVLRRFFKGSAS